MPHKPPRYIPCENCSKQFKTHRNRTNTGWKKFCSLSCRWEHERKKSPKVTCENCKKVFSVPPSFFRTRNLRFCSWNCTKGVTFRRRKKPVERVVTSCLRCKEPITHRVTERRVYCSQACAGTTRQDKNEIHRRIQTKTWAEIRKSVLRRDCCKCSVCGELEELIVHHIIPWVKTRDDSESNLITLCRPCHYQVEWLGLPCPTPPS
jgi:hypothetical protein